MYFVVLLIQVSFLISSHHVNSCMKLFTSHHLLTMMCLNVTLQAAFLYKRLVTERTRESSIIIMNPHMLDQCFLQPVLFLTNLTFKILLS